jgi:5-methylcytosine-specific restriction endonuclease McrA
MPNYNNTRKRRMRKRMYKRQKGLCWICGERMCISAAAASSPNYATFDHLDPKSNGGTNAQANLKLAHRKCNSLRSALPIVHTMIATGQL